MTRLKGEKESRWRREPQAVEIGGSNTGELGHRYIWHKRNRPPCQAGRLYATNCMVAARRLYLLCLFWATLIVVLAPGR